MFFYDSKNTSKVSVRAGRSDKESTVFPYLSILHMSVFDFNYHICSDENYENNEFYSTINRVYKRPGTALEFRKAKLFDNDIRSLSKHITYFCSPSFYPEIEYLVHEGFNIYSANSSFYTGFKPGGINKGIIISQATENRLVQIKKNVLGFQTFQPNDNGDYLTRTGLYSFYTKEQLPSPELSILKIEDI